jgi:hypothetical protein
VAPATVTKAIICTAAATPPATSHLTRPLSPGGQPKAGCGFPIGSF